MQVNCNYVIFYHQVRWIQDYCQGFFSGFFQVGKGKKWIFPGGEKRKLGGILPEKHAILRVKKFKNLFLSKISGGGEIDFRGGVLPTCPTEKPPDKQIVSTF